MKALKIFLSHLGCAKNMVDTEIFLSHFLKLGFVETESSAHADLILVNTCGLIGPAKEQSIDTIFHDIKNDHYYLVLMVALLAILLAVMFENNRRGNK